MAIKVWLDTKIESWPDGSSISMPDYYGIFAANAVRMLGRRVEIIDLNNMFRTEKTSMTIPVHINGRLSNAIDIEDCAQAIDHHTDGALSCYSFHPSKLMTCAGIGGAICCDEIIQYHELAALKDHGRPERQMGHPITDYHSKIGSNFKMSDICAAFGIEQLKKLPDRLARLAQISKIYQDILKRECDTPKWRIDCLVDNPDRVIAELSNIGFEAKRFYLPLHRQPQYSKPDYDYPNAMTLYDHGVYLPSDPRLTDNDVSKVCEILLRENNLQSGI